MTKHISNLPVREERVCAMPGCGCVFPVSLVDRGSAGKRFCSRDCLTYAPEIVEQRRAARPPPATLTVLTEDEVLMLRQSSESDKVLAERMGLPPPTIRRARKRITWRHLP